MAASFSSVHSDNCSAVSCPAITFTIFHDLVHFTTSCPYSLKSLTFRFTDSRRGPHPPSRMPGDRFSLDSVWSHCFNMAPQQTQQSEKRRALCAKEWRCPVFGLLYTHYSSSPLRVKKLPEQPSRTVRPLQFQRQHKDANPHNCIPRH